MVMRIHTGIVEYDIRMGVCMLSWCGSLEFSGAKLHLTGATLSTRSIDDSYSFSVIIPRILEGLVQFLRIFIREGFSELGELSLVIARRPRQIMMKAGEGHC